MPSTRCAGTWAVFAAAIGLAAVAHAQLLSPSNGEAQSAVFVSAESSSAQPATGAEKEPDRPPAGSAPADATGRRRAGPENRLPAIPLKPPSRSERGGATSPAVPQSGLRTVVSVLGSLGAVLGAFFVVAWVVRRGMPGAVGLLPREALEVLGRAPLAGRQQVHLIRLGSKLVLVSVTPTGAETLSEVTEPDEVQRLLAICRQEQPASSTSAFRQTLERFDSDRESATATRPRGREAASPLLGLRSGPTVGLKESTHG